MQIDAQEWLDKNYPVEKRNTITELHINRSFTKKLFGPLKLDDFINLEKLDCSNNKITSLSLSNCRKLKIINCDWNKLSNLNDFSQLENLENLIVSNNYFIGSLAPLTNLKKLEFLNINNTELDDGLECLPASLVMLRCNIISFNKKLEGYESKSRIRGYYNYQAWNKDFKELKELGFTPKEINQWANLHFKISEFDLATYYLRKKKATNHSEIYNDNLEQLKIKKEFDDWLKNTKTAEDYLSVYYPQERRDRIKKLELNDKRLTGELNLTEFVNLKELNASNNQLTEITISPDAIWLDRINIKNNPNLDYNQIDGKFLKYLPILTKKEIKPINEEEFRKMIKEKVKLHGNIKDIEIIPAWWNPNCALVTSKKSYYAVRLIIYESASEQMPEVWKIKRFPNQNPLSGYLRSKEVTKKIEGLKRQLNSDNPILALYSDTNFSSRDILHKTELPQAAIENPDHYLQPADMVWRNMKGMPGAYHVAVYLGNQRVAHIGSSKFLKAINVKGEKKLLGARNDHWKDFLHSDELSELKLINNRFLIPFQKPEQIQKLLTSAIVSNYGEKEYNLLKENCEHFATLCVAGIPFSTQVDKLIFTNRLGKLVNPKNLLSEMVANEQFLTSRVSFEKLQKSKKDFLDNRLQRIKSLEEKIELTSQEKESLAQYRFEYENLNRNQLQIQIEQPPK